MIDTQRKIIKNKTKKLQRARYIRATANRKNMIHSELSGGKYVEYEQFDKFKIMRDDLSGNTPIPQFRSNATLQEESYLIPYHKVPFQDV